MKIRALAIAAVALVMTFTTAGFSQAAGRTGGHAGGHHHAGPRVSIGVGVGIGGFYDPFWDPYYDYWYPSYGAGYVPQPPVPCTPADAPKTAPTNNQFSPDYAYDRIDANRCSPEAVAASSAPTTVAPATVPQPPMYYFCRDSNAYYPNVRDCPGGWETVPPKPGPF